MGFLGIGPKEFKKDTRKLQKTQKNLTNSKALKIFMKDFYANFGMSQYTEGLSQKKRIPY